MVVRLPGFTEHSPSFTVMSQPVIYCVPVIRTKMTFFNIPNDALMDMSYTVSLIYEKPRIKYFSRYNNRNDISLCCAN